MMTDDERKRMQRALEEARDYPGIPHLRDILKREHDEALKRPRDVAYEKWGPMIEEQIERDLWKESWKKPHGLPPVRRQPKKDGPDMDR